jgi:Copper type II ascorbate-dependent monooxygenase, C-terminal domain
MKRSFFLLVLLTLALNAAAAKQRAVRHPSPPSGPTFSNEVVRIFQQHCQTCHREGDIAPFSLVTYAEAKPYAQLIKLMTQTRKMPPWKPTDGCGEFTDERKLTQQQIDTIAKWVDAGAPEGNPAQLPPPLDFGNGWALGTPDLVLANAESYTPGHHGDTYRCFSIPTTAATTRYVRAVDVHPGDRETVHHVLTFLDTTGVSAELDAKEEGPGYTCFGDPGFTPIGTLGGWAPGSRPLEMPEDVAFELPAGARVVMQVHYHPHGGHPGPDRTELGVYFMNKQPRATMRIFPIINQDFTIPAGASNHRVEGEFFILTPFPAKLWLVAPHMHLLGRKMTVKMTMPGGETRCLINIDDWDFNWQGTYRYREPIDVPAGTRLWLEAFYDNSSNNPRNPNNPPKPVSWGEQTTDEMCLAFVGVTVE